MFKPGGEQNRSGFTLIEILVVIGIMAVLAAIVIVAINPARQFAQARNTQRTSDVSAVSNAIGQNIADNRGTIPSAIPTGTAVEIKKAAGGADLCSWLVSNYMAALPMDPSISGAAGVTDCTATYTTGYFVVRDATTNRITVSAPSAELSASIAVTR